MKRFFTIIFFLLFYVTVDAQSDSIEKPQFKLSVNYNTAINYFGRTDSLRSSAFFPTAELWFTPKFYVNASPIFVNNPVQSFEYAGTVATLGFQSVTEHWMTSLYALKPFYEQSSKLVQAALKAQAGFNVSFLNPILNLNAGADLKFSDQTDIGVTAGVDHVIRIETGDGSALVIDPSIYTYAGTQRFQQTYYRKSGGILGIGGSNRTVTEDVQRFKMLAYEVSVPVVFSKQKWMLIANPSYIMPQNLVTVPNRPDLSERGEDLFYTTLSLKYTF